MENLTLTKEQFQAYKLIELSVYIQSSIEILDELNETNHPLKNKKLASQLKAIYPALDKQTKTYNELFEVNQEGISHFYDVTKRNTEYIMSNNILDKSRICSFLIASEINPTAVEGIINKIIKSKSK